jgi:hypothetical protein
MMNRFTKSILLLLVAYAGTYVAFRQINQEVWLKDQQTYVMFSPGEFGRVLYYLWRPLSHLDGALTGMRFHIGPHR